MKVYFEGLRVNDIECPDAIVYSDKVLFKPRKGKDIHIPIYEITGMSCSSDASSAIAMIVLGIVGLNVSINQTYLNAALAIIGLYLSVIWMWFKSDTLELIFTDKKIIVTTNRNWLSGCRLKYLMNQIRMAQKMIDQFRNSVNPHHI